LPGALQDFDEAIAYYHERSPRAAQNLMQAIRAGERLIRDFPALAPTLGHRLRALPVSRFPYSFVYFLGEDEIVVVAVAHQSRLPGYWK
jgi:toxin ParE1/3/4